MVLGIADTARCPPPAPELITVPMFLLMANSSSSAAWRTIYSKPPPPGSAASWWPGHATAFAGAGFDAISAPAPPGPPPVVRTIPAMLRRADPSWPAAWWPFPVPGGAHPPSIALVLFGIIAARPIGALLIGDVIPGLMVTLAAHRALFGLAGSEPGPNLQGKFISQSWSMLVLFMAVTGIITSA